MSRTRTIPRRRRLALAAGATVLASSAAVAGSAATAEAAGGTNIDPGQTTAVRTYFFGKTVICVQNLSPLYSSFRATSLSTVVSAALAPGQENCTALNRSWFGANVYVYNQGGVGQLRVSTPFGP